MRHSIATVLTFLWIIYSPSSAGLDRPLGITGNEVYSTSQSKLAPGSLVASGQDAGRWHPGTEIADFSTDQDFFRVTSADFLPTGDVAVANAGTNEIFVFSQDGERKATLGGHGSGPGMFIQLFFTHVRPDGTIVGVDARGQRVVLFTMDGALPQTIRVHRAALRPVWDIYPLSDGRWIEVTSWRTALLKDDRSTGLKRRDIHVLLLDENGGLLRTIASVPGTEIFWWAPDSGGMTNLDPPYGRKSIVTVAPDGKVYVGTGEDPVIQVYDIDGQTMGTLSLPNPDLELPTSEWRDRIELLTERVEAAYRPRRRRMFRDLQKPDERPPYSGIIVGQDGRVWVEPFHHQDEATPGWWVFSDEGEYLAWMESPQGTAQLLAAASDRIVVKTLTPLEVEGVKLLTIRKGDP